MTARVNTFYQEGSISEKESTPLDALKTNADTSLSEGISAFLDIVNTVF
jgi:hypothetical protein